MLSPSSSPTAFNRLLMAVGLSSGFSSTERIRRLPIGVRVWSSTHSSVPLRSPVRRVLVSSRLRRAVRSRVMYWSSLYTSRWVRLSNPCFWVWVRY